MGYLLVENFGEGLDTRRSLLTTKPGALLVCKNAHITRGKEIEKRKKFTPFVTLPAGTFGLQSAANSLYVFGSAPQPANFPPSVTYRQFTAPGNPTMTQVLWSETFNGLIYCVARFSDGSVHHFYDGITGNDKRVTDWGLISAGVSSLTTVASSLSAQIDGEVPFVSTSVGASLLVTGPEDGTAFSFSASAINGGTNTTQSITATVERQAVLGVPETGPVTSLSKVAEFLANLIDGSQEFNATPTGNVLNIVGDINVPFTVQVSSVNGGSNPTQSITKTNIVEASETSAQVTQVIITGPFEPNDTYTVTINGNPVSVTTHQPAIPPISQQVKFVIGGTYESNDQYQISLTIPQQFSKTFLISGAASGAATTVRTFNDKVYATTRSILYFSAVGDAGRWKATSATDAVGSGLINITTQEGGGENLTALGVYQNRLAVFSRNSTQIWAMDADPAKNIKVQVLPNFGTFAPRSVTSFGDLDVFFLSDSGIRSLRARDASNAATVSDIGTSIDNLIQEEMRVVGDTVRNSAIGIIEPQDGRYWLSIGNKIYVFSYFPTSQVSAWSTYEPGFEISEMSYSSGRVYVRSGNTVYLYGGVSGEDYDDCEVEVVIPYLDGSKPAHMKTIEGIDMACENVWTVSIGTDISSPQRRIYAGTISNSSFMVGRILHFGIGTHVSTKLVCKSLGKARIGNLAIHYRLSDPE